MPSGMMARKTIVTPCMVNIWLYASGASSVLFGTASWRRIRNASTDAAARNRKLVTM